MPLPQINTNHSPNPIHQPLTHFTSHHTSYHWKPATTAGTPKAKLNLEAAWVKDTNLAGLSCGGCEDKELDLLHSASFCQKVLDCFGLSPLYFLLGLVPTALLNCYLLQSIENNFFLPFNQGLLWGGASGVAARVLRSFKASMYFICFKNTYMNNINLFCCNCILMIKVAPLLSLVWTMMMLVSSFFTLNCTCFFF